MSVIPKFTILSDSISLGEYTWISPPAMSELMRVLDVQKWTIRRNIRYRGVVEERLVAFDSLGIEVKEAIEGSFIKRITFFFLSKPLEGYSGEVWINDSLLRRGAKSSDLNKSGDFVFKNGIAITSRFSASYSVKVDMLETLTVEFR